jgi:hypothetical protein
MEWIVLLIVIVVLGALVGGNSFGETIRKGIGCLVVIFLILVALAMFGAGSQG